VDQDIAYIVLKIISLRRSARFANTSPASIEITACTTLKTFRGLLIKKLIAGDVNL
jgi:hypothetical protein